MRRIAGCFLVVSMLCSCTTWANETDGGIYGIVLQPDGKPAAEVSVAMATHKGWTNFENNVIPDNQGTHYITYVASTDKDGRFQFKYIDFDKESEGKQFHFRPEETVVDFILFIRHDTGFKRITQKDWEALNAGLNGEEKTITLEPWGRIEGTVKIGTKPGKNVKVG
jgi:hypothetical protein